MKSIETYRKHLQLIITALLLIGIGQDSCARVISVGEAAEITRNLSIYDKKKDLYDVEGVVDGTCDALRSDLLLNLDICEGDVMMFVYNLSSFDSIPFTDREMLERGDTIVIRTQLQNYRGTPSSYCGYLLEVRKYVDPTLDLIKATKDKEWQLLVEAKRNESQMLLFCICVGLSLPILLLIFFWVWRLRRLARRDPLTGLLNRRAARASMQMKMRLRRQGFLCVIDIDNFKQVNDRYGHRVGDECLLKVAHTIRHHFSGLRARIDGNAFIVYVPHDDRERLRDQFKHFISDIQDIRLSADGSYIVSVSIGAAYFDGAGNLDQLYQRADYCLYSSKQHEGSWFT